MNRRKFLRAVGVGAASLAVPYIRRAAAQPRKPNIVFILADDLGYGHLGCYGQEKILTPNIDRLAAEGMRFTQFYAGYTVCAPSRSVLMTGLHTGHTPVRTNGGGASLWDDEVTVAEVLKQAGYVTGIIGKWGLGEPGTTGIPTRQGFDYWFGYLNQRRAHNYYPDYLWRNEEKVVLEGNLGGKKTQYSHDLFTAEALQFIRKHKSEPFFLYLAYTVPHANNELGRATGDGMEVPDYGPYANENWPNPEKGRAAMIYRLDRDVGKILALLKELGIDEDTIIFFSSDNGPHREGGSSPDFFDSNGPLRGIKRDLYEGGIRVPMIVRWPGKINAGTVSHFPWAFWDFLPTAAEIAGVAPPQGIDGMSVLPTLLGRQQKPHEFFYWEFHERGFTQAVRMGKWKAVRFGLNEPLELYDLSTDIGEQHNIAAEHPEIVAKIEEYLKTARVDSKEFPIRERKNKPKQK